MGNFWNKVAASYDSTTNKTYQEANEKIIKYTKKYIQNKNKLLDIGCGTGFLTCQLSECVKEIYAIDGSEEMIKIANQTSKKQNIENIKWKVANLSNFSISKDTYDVITLFNVLLYVDDPYKLVKYIYDQMPSGGYFISVTDCMGEKFSILSILATLGSKLKIFPYMQKYKIHELCEIIKSAGFSIEFGENVYTTPPNYYIVAKK